MATKNGSKAAAPAKEVAPTIEAPVQAPDPKATAYNAIPYQSKPFAQSTPEQLAAMAKLFGLTPTAYAHRDSFALMHALRKLGSSATTRVSRLSSKF